MSESVYCSAVHHHLPVGTGRVHLVNERRHVRPWAMRIERTVTDQDWRLDVARLRALTCRETSVDRYDSRQRHARAGEFQCHHSPETVADNRDGPGCG